MRRDERANPSTLSAVDGMKGKTKMKNLEIETAEHSQSFSQFLSAFRALSQGG